MKTYARYFPRTMNSGACRQKPVPDVLQTLIVSGKHSLSHLCWKKLLGAQAVRRVLAHGRLHRHHVVHVLHLKAVPCEVEQSVYVFAQEGEEVVDSLGGVKCGGGRRGKRGGGRRYTHLYIHVHDS